eukprot:323801-Chlamydomonas_euryale.AAC.3
MLACACAAQAFVCEADVGVCMWCGVQCVQRVKVLHPEMRNRGRIGAMVRHTQRKHKAGCDGFLKVWRSGVGMAVRCVKKIACDVCRVEKNDRSRAACGTQERRHGKETETPFVQAPTPE